MMDVARRALVKYFLKRKPWAEGLKKYAFCEQLRIACGFIMCQGRETGIVADYFRWEDAKGAYLKFINKLIMGHTEIFSYTNTHIHL